ncbi:hypothetical protein F2P81_003878 [Scophthalmus maximus]|uniref:Uncharacterized protein n=1 Tax=Scophthalmus maximus TaxID=52904 RepID=A0A6A4TM64_SCOMX|nr:hypothetical protein F2P81_003878 [Scophthalmus maximus]
MNFVPSLLVSGCLSPGLFGESLLRLLDPPDWTGLSLSPAPLWFVCSADRLFWFRSPCSPDYVSCLSPNGTLWLYPELLNNFLIPPSVNQAANANKPNLKLVPRAILVKFRWLTDRDRVMKAARKYKSLQLEENRVMFFPDLSAEIQQQRRMFDGVKAQLQNLDIEFGLQFPAKMRIYHRGKPRTFLTPADVEAFIQKIENSLSLNGTMTHTAKKLSRINPYNPLTVMHGFILQSLNLKDSFCVLACILDRQLSSIWASYMTPRLKKKDREDLIAATQQMQDYLANAGCLCPLRKIDDKEQLVRDLLMFQVVHGDEARFQRLFLSFEIVRIKLMNEQVFILPTRNPVAGGTRRYRPAELGVTGRARGYRPA